MGKNLAIDVIFSYSTGDELAVLRSKVEDRAKFVVENVGHFEPFSSGGLVAFSRSQYRLFIRVHVVHSAFSLGGDGTQLEGEIPGV